MHGRETMVYLIDDDLRIHEALSALFSSAGRSLKAFLDPDEFFAFRRPDLPACLILDLQLPGTTGLEVQAELAQGSTPPIIFLTGKGDIPSTVKAMKAGAVEVLQKPFDADDLLAAVDAALLKDIASRTQRQAVTDVTTRYRRLTPKEREVLPFVVSGLLSKQTAGILGTSEVTVRVHRGNILRKMKADSLADDVKEGDLWVFPAGTPHSIQGTGEDGCEFLLVFNQGSFSEEDTFLLSDWLMHTPPDILAKNFGLGMETIAKLPKNDPLYIFPSTAPTQSLEQDRQEVQSRVPKPTKAFTFKTNELAPVQSNEHGTMKIIDVHNFPASPKICAALVTLKPGGLRELHWHPNASEWQFWLKGGGRMTVFNAQSAARTMDFNANDVGFVPKMAGHYVENTGNEDCVFLEMFVASEVEEISLNQWLRALPVQVAMAHTNFSAEELDRIPVKVQEVI